MNKGKEARKRQRAGWLRRETHGKSDRDNIRETSEWMRKNGLDEEFFLLLEKTHEP
jgi:hypothetical protein